MDRSKVVAPPPIICPPIQSLLNPGLPAKPVNSKVKVEPAADKLTVKLL